MEREAPFFFENVCLLMVSESFCPICVPKTFQNSSQIGPKSSPNGCKIEFRRLPRPSRFWDSFSYPPGAHLGQHSPNLAPKLEHKLSSGRSWGVLETSWSRLGAILGRKSLSTRLNSFWLRFSIDFGSKDGASKLQKSLKLECKNHIFQLSGRFNIRSVLERISAPTWLYFGSIFRFSGVVFLLCRVVCSGSGKLPKTLEKSTTKPPKSTPKPSKSTLKRCKIHPKTLQNRGLEGIALRIAFGTPYFRNFHRKCRQHGSNLGPKMEPK